jgi:stage II sporulation protein M
MKKMSTAAPAERDLWDEIEIERWVKPPEGLKGKRKANPLVTALNGNRVLIEFCLIAFIIGTVAGFFLSEQSSDVMVPVIESLGSEFSLDGSRFQLATQIFLHNLRATLLLLISGTLIFIPLLSLILNGFLVGFVLKSFLVRGYSIPEFIQSLFFHSIFELPAVFISSAIGIRIGLAYLLSRGNRTIAVSQRIKEAGAIYITVVIPLLLLAAFIEVYISTRLLP